MSNSYQDSIIYNPNPFNTNNQKTNTQNSNNNSNQKKDADTIDTEYTDKTGVTAFNKNEMVSLSDNYAKFGSTELNKDPLEQEFKFYTDVNGQKILIGEDTKNIFQEFQNKN